MNRNAAPLVEVISKATIRPSSRTPNHLKTFQLSAIDQSAPELHLPFFLFYPSSDDNSARLGRLQESLSKTLSLFYPLAGRINGNKYIRCDDMGINFFEARVHAVLSQILNHPEVDELESLLPRDKLLALGPNTLLSVQVSIFDCGGIVVGVLVSHKVADAFSACLFLRSWASISRHDAEFVCPKFGITSLFPPRNMPSAMPYTGNPPRKIVTKRFIFEGENIASLRAKSSHDMLKKLPSRVEAIIALIWRCAMRAARMSAKSVIPASVASLPVNLRGKLLPHLTDQSFGNCVVRTMTRSVTMESHLQLHDLVGLLREAITVVESSDHASQLEVGAEMFLDSCRGTYEQCTNGEMEHYSFSSLCNFGFYETDFGWGKPIWTICTGNVGLENVVVLMDAKSGDGVEALVSLNEEDMVRFEYDPSIISFTSAKPGPVKSKI